MSETPAADPGRTEMPEALRAELMPDAENLAVALTEAVLADGLGFKGPFEEFGRIAEPLLLDALGAARRDGAQIANEAASAEIAQLRSRLLEAEKGAEAMRKALKPFAKAGELFGPRESDSYDQAVYMPAAGPEYGISGDDLRRARAALNPNQEAGDGA